MQKVADKNAVLYATYVMDDAKVCPSLCERHILRLSIVRGTNRKSFYDL